MAKQKHKHPLALEGSVKSSKYFFFDTEPNAEAELALIFGGFERCASDFEIKRNSYPYYVLEVPVSGRCWLKIEDTDYELCRGRVGAFAPGQSHHYICDSENPMHHLFVAFTGWGAEGLLQQCGFDSRNVLSVAWFEDIVFLAEMLVKRAYEKHDDSQRLCVSYLKTLMLEVAGQSLKHRPSAVPASLDTYRQCRKYIDDHFSEILLPSEAADKCGINVRYMSRLFRKYANITPHEYIMRLKLNKAANLLLNSTSAIKEIAEMVGFEDPYHFSRNFKKFHTVSPNQYRKIHISYS